MRKREETPVCDTWDLTDILPSDEAFEKLYGETEESLNGYQSFEGRLAESGRVLYECLKFDEAVSLKIETLFVYGKQKSDQDTRQAKYQDYAARAQALSFRGAGLSSYILPEILGMDEERLAALKSEEKELSHFDRTFEIVAKKRAHTLRAKEEALLAQSMEATHGASDIFNMFNNADVKFPSVTDGEGKEVAVTHASYISLLESRDRNLREAAFMSMYSAYQQFANTLAATFSANVKQAVFYGSARNYSSSRAYYLAENEVPETVYDNLIEAVGEGLPKLHSYVKIRKEALGLDELHMYDLYTPMVKGTDLHYTFEEAKNLVKEGLAPLGEEYLSVLERGFKERWIDVYENEGKRSGAYSWGVYGTHPYVLLNYSGTLDSVFTLAHEMGHSLHSYFSDKNQSYNDAGYKIFVAEVASTCNEALLIRHLLKVTEDKGQKAYLLNHFMESFRGTLFRQTMFAEFEADVHERAQKGEVLTAELLCRIYHELNVKYFGEEMVVDSQIDYEWARIPHFYTPFYVYQYATGFSAAIAISNGILAGDEAVKEGYFKFLAGGNSMPPLELLKLCGVDMSTAEPVKAAIDLFGRLLEEFKSL